MRPRAVGAAPRDPAERTVIRDYLGAAFESGDTAFITDIFGPRGGDGVGRLARRLRPGPVARAAVAPCLALLGRTGAGLVGLVARPSRMRSAGPAAGWSQAPAA